MTNQLEALKMAIEFIERHVEADEYDWLIQACKEALAEAEKQEPVMWWNETMGLDGVEWNKESGLVPLYTHPATWQSLSDDEIRSMEIDTRHFMIFARAIEQALKEKNHG